MENRWHWLNLLIGEELRLLPPEVAVGVKGIKKRLCKRCRLLCNLKQVFWKIWYRANRPPQQWLTTRVVAVSKCRAIFLELKLET